MEVYKKILKKGEYALLKSSCEYFNCHYKNSPLNLLTGFSGTAGEALIDFEGKITLFVDPRYHEQADFESKGKNVDVIKLKFAQSFASEIKKIVKESVLHVPNSISLMFYDRLKAQGLKLKPYEDLEGFGENINIDLKKEIFTLDELRSFKTKFNELKKRIKQRFYLVTSLEEIAYLTNLRSFQMPEISTFKARLLLDFDSKSILFCDELLGKAFDFEVRPMSEYKGVIEKIKTQIAIKREFMTLGEMSLISKPYELKKNYIAKMASIKQKKEINHLKSAFLRLDKALFAFKNRIKEGLSEFELKEIFEEELIKAGAKTTSFKTILAVADNSSSIHYSNYDKNKILKKGNLILLDCGGYYEYGLATDITRVFLCSNKASSKQKEIYTAVLKAFLNCYHSEAKSGEQMDKIARKILKPYEKQGFLFPHALGHGIGIPVHQSPPTISSYGARKFPLYNNMTHTIEPGLYCEKKPHKFGIRLENTVYVTSLGKRNSFSHFEFEENLIEKKMLTKRELKWLNAWQNEWRELCENNFEQ